MNNILLICKNSNFKICYYSRTNESLKSPSSPLSDMLLAVNPVLENPCLPPDRLSIVARPNTFDSLSPISASCLLRPIKLSFLLRPRSLVSLESYMVDTPPILPSFTNPNVLSFPDDV